MLLDPRLTALGFKIDAEKLSAPDGHGCTIDDAAEGACNVTLPSGDVVVVPNVTWSLLLDAIDAVYQAEYGKNVDALWTALRDTTAFPAVRYLAGACLVQRGDPGLFGYILERFVKEALGDTERAMLCLVAERAQCSDPVQREAMAAALLEQAQILRGSSRYRPVLWACLRRSASLLAVERLDGLLEFLGPDDPDETRQCVFQCLRHVFEREVPPDGGITDAFLLRVRPLADIYLGAPHDQADGRRGTLAWTAFVALAVLGDPELPVRARALKPLSSGYIRRVADQLLADLEALWAATPSPRNEAMCAAFRASRECLREP